MNVTHPNAVSIPKDEFYETFATIQALLAHDSEPDDFVVEDPFMAACPVKVDLRKHLQRLYERMYEVKQSMTPATRMVTIDFN